MNVKPFIDMIDVVVVAERQIAEGIFKELKATLIEDVGSVW